MAGLTLTAANAVILLQIEGLYPTPQQLQGFAADDVFGSESVSPTEAVMGVDGNMSAGFVFNPVRQNFSLQADSASNAIFENWFATLQKAREVYFASGIIVLNAVKRKYSMTRGTLTSYPPTPDARRILQSRRYQITWQRVEPAPF